MSDAPLRYIGRPEPYEEFFWASGADGRLRLAHCGACDRFHHPPQPVCPHCQDLDVEPQPVSGLGTVASYTVNHQPFMPGFEPPYVIALVEVDEDPTIRLCANIEDCSIDEVDIGMRVGVVFEEAANGDETIFVPLFAPVDETEEDG